MNCYYLKSKSYPRTQDGKVRILNPVLLITQLRSSGQRRQQKSLKNGVLLSNSLAVIEPMLENHGFVEGTWREKKDQGAKRKLDI